MVKFTEDSVVDPRASEWFEFFEPNQAVKILPLNESRIYQEDWIGLKTLDNEGKLIFLESEGNHLQFSKEFFIEKIIKPYLL